MAKSAQSNDSATLKGVCDRLDVLIALLLAPASPVEPPTGLQLDIFRMCDYEHTTEEIRSAVKKSATHVSKELSLLRSKGLVRTVQRDGRQVHVRVR